MPIYEYKCPQCGETFELRRPMSQATDPAQCPSCKIDAPRAISRLARVSHGGSSDEGADDFGGDMGGDDDFGGGFGGHSHDHGALGHHH
jgi:putative FmdB family regulatory protein